MMKPPSSAGAMLSAWKPLTAASLARPAGTSAALASGAPNSALTASAAAAALAALLPRPLPSGRPCAGRARRLGPGAPLPARCQAAGLAGAGRGCAAPRGRHARPDTWTRACGKVASSEAVAACRAAAKAAARRAALAEQLRSWQGLKAGPAFSAGEHAHHSAA
jgi:hypothetical protein